MGISQASVDELFAQAEAAGPAAREEPAPATPPPPSRPGPVPPRGTPVSDIRRILSLSVPVSVALAERDMPVEMILAIRVGTIIEFDVSFDAELTLQVANQPIARGHAVKVGEKFGLRITGIDAVEDRIEALGGSSSSP